MTEHPSSSELLAEATEPNDAGSVRAHISTCLTCQVILGRLRAHGVAPSAGVREDFVATGGEPSLPASLVTALTRSSGSRPAPGEIWRVIGTEGMIMFVRRLVDEETVDAVPVTLDTEMADDETLLVPAAQSPVASELAVFVGFRSHVHVDAFANRLGDLHSIVTDVELMASGAMPASITAAVGAPVTHGDDQRLEYQQFLRAFLSDVSPAAWVRKMAHCFGDVPLEELESRISGIQIRPSRADAGSAQSAVAVLARAVCLNSVVLVCRLETQAGLPEGAALASACRDVVRDEPDVDAIAVFRPLPERPAVLFTRQDLRDAIELPAGGSVAPGPSLGELPLADLLFKHFDGSVLPTSWGPGSRLGGAVAGRLTSRTRLFAEHKAAELVTHAARAIIPEKRSGWGAAASQVDVVVQFVELLEAGDAEGALGLIVGDSEP